MSINETLSRVIKQYVIHMSFSTLREKDFKW